MTLAAGHERLWIAAGDRETAGDHPVESDLAGVTLGDGVGGDQAEVPLLRDSRT